MIELIQPDIIVSSFIGTGSAVGISALIIYRYIGNSFTNPSKDVDVDLDQLEELENL